MTLTARRWLAVLLGWLIPGLGYFYLGRRIKALFLFGILAATYIAGLTLCGFRTVWFDSNPFYAIGHFGSGIGFLIGRLFSFANASPQTDHVGWFDTGLLYVCVVGLLNLVIVLSHFEVTLPEKKVSEGTEEVPKRDETLTTGDKS